MKLPGAIYTLDVLDWSVSIGGRHFTGKLSWHEDPPKTDGSDYRHHELERDLSLKEAKELDPDIGERSWRLGGRFRKSNRFDTLEQLERHAARWVKTDCDRRGELIWLLLDYDSCNPRRPIAAQGWDKTRLKLMTDLAAAWDKVPDWARLDGHKPTDLWKAAYQLWTIFVSDTGSLEANVKPAREAVTQLKRTATKLAKR